LIVEERAIEMSLVGERVGGKNRHILVSLNEIKSWFLNCWFCPYLRNWVTDQV
jgi:hypothetical protein